MWDVAFVCQYDALEEAMHLLRIPVSAAFYVATN